MPTPMIGREAAEFWLKKGNYPKALLALRPLQKQEPKDAQIAFQIGFCLYKVGAYEEANSQLTRTLEFDPNHQEAKKLIERIQYNPDVEGSQKIPDNVFNDAIAKNRVLPKITCPQCNNEILKGCKECSVCGYIFPHYRLIKAFVSVAIVVGFFAAGRFYFLGAEAFYVPLPTPGLVAGFFVGFLQTSTTLFAAALLTNYAEPNKDWNFEWKLDLGASFLAALCMVPVNAYTYFLTTQISKVPGWGLFLIAPPIIEFVAALFLIWLFFQRKWIFLFLLILIYYCISPLIYVLFYPLRWLVSFV